MAPFLAVVAAEPAGQDLVSAIVSGGYGGNLVLRDLGVGSHLCLPVAKPGGRVWVGDVHALQGDGVVDQTAIETAAENLEIRYGARSHRPRSSTDRPGTGRRPAVRVRTRRSLPSA
jgi:acetamidase/formamidase